MKRVLIIGNGGAGKSTFARRLGEKTGLPVVHLDPLFWLPNWQERDYDEFDGILKSELEKDAWIIDGNYRRWIPMRLNYTDTMIQLDYNRFLCFWRILKRLIIHRKEQAKGCSPTFDIGFFWYTLWRYPRRRKEAMAYKEQYPNVQWITLNSPKEAEQFIDSI